MRETSTVSPLQRNIRLLQPRPVAQAHHMTTNCCVNDIKNITGALSINVSLFHDERPAKYGTVSLRILSVENSLCCTLRLRSVTLLLRACPAAAALCRFKIYQTLHSRERDQSK